MNRDANPFFGTNQPSQVSGPDELLAEQLDKILAAGDWESTVPAALLERCRTRIADYAALAARCGELQAAIDELVACKVMKNYLDGGSEHSPQEWRRVHDDYYRRKGIAWDEAAALASQAEGEK